MKAVHSLLQRNNTVRTLSAAYLLLADRRPRAWGDPVVRPRIKRIGGLENARLAQAEVAAALLGDGRFQRLSSAGSGSEDQRGHRTGATGVSIAILKRSDTEASSHPGDLPLIRILSRIALAVAVREDAAGKATMAERTRHASPRTLRSGCLVETDEEPR